MLGSKLRDRGPDKHGDKTSGETNSRSRTPSWWQKDKRKQKGGKLGHATRTGRKRSRKETSAYTKRSQITPLGQRAREAARLGDQTDRGGKPAWLGVFGGGAWGSRGGGAWRQRYPGQNPEPQNQPCNFRTLKLCSPTLEIRNPRTLATLDPWNFGALEP